MFTFVAGLISLFALVVGFVIVTFTPLRRKPQRQRVFLTAFSVGGIAALGWSGALLLGEISGMGYLIRIAVLFLCGAAISLLAASESVSEKMKDKPVDSRARERTFWDGPRI
jgi:hypothetical protein